MRRISGLAAIVVGILFIGGAGVVHWVVVPQLAQLPAHQTTTRLYTGNAAIVANPTLVTGTRIGPGLMRDVPIAVRHTTGVIATSGHQALVHDERVMTMPGFTLADLVNRFDVDRRTFLPGDAFPSAVHASGITFNWPMGTKPHDYTGWVSDTGRTTVLHYAGTAQHAGITTYVYKVHTGFAPIRDPQVLKLLPGAMTKSQLLDVTPSLLYTQKHLLKLAATMDGAPNSILLAYDYKANGTFWVAPDSGIVVDHQQSEVRSLSLLIDANHVRIAPVMAMTYHFTPATVTAAADDAKSAAAQLKLVRRTLPVGLLIGGLVLLVVGIALLAWRRKSPKGDDSDAALAELLRDSNEPLATHPS